MSNTRKIYNSKKRTTRKKSRSAKMMEQVKQNRRRNRMIRNIRMGRIYGGQICGGGNVQTGGKSFFSPWTPDSLSGNFFSLSPKGVGTGLVPKFDDGQPLYSARFPTQLGPQVPKLGQVGGGGGGGGRSRKKLRKNIKGGGFLDDVTYSFGKLNSRMAGTIPPADPKPYNQPISSRMI
jgi:hypothetical protein